MTCPPLVWNDAILIGAALVWLSGAAFGLWAGFKLWRQSYVQLGRRPRMFGLSVDQ